MGNDRHASHYVFQFGYYALLAAAAAGILFSFSSIFPSIFASVILALLLDPVVSYWETRGAPRVAVILVIYVLIAATLAMLFSFLIPMFIDELKNFAANLPAYESVIHGVILRARKLIVAHVPGLSLPDYYPHIKDAFVVLLQKAMTSAPALATGAVSLVSMALLVPLITFFLLADGHLISKALLVLVPNRHFEMSVLLLQRILDALKDFVRGQLIDSCAITVLTTAGYAAVGLPYFIVVGLVSGLANFIPYFGPIISFCAAFFVLLITPGMFTVWSVVAVAGVFLAIQAIDGTLIYPNVMGKNVNLHPLVVILGIAAGGNLAGVLGMLLAIPLISLCKVTLEVLHAHLKSYSII